jgi:hypothetical protein
MHVALGWEYRGRRVKAGTVVYVACEGEAGQGARAEAFRQKYLTEDDADPPFYLLPTRLDLVADISELIRDIRASIQPGPCALIVVDTLNRSIAGSESKDEDMTAYVRAADAVREAFGCAVALIHHCGVNDSRPRGHTSLTAAADAQISVKRGAAGEIIATVEHLKDGPEGDEILSRLIPVDVGTDEEGEAITSCVVMPVEGSAVTARKKVGAKRLPNAVKLALDTLHKAIAEAGEPAPTSNHIPPAARIVSVETWRRFYYTGTASDGQNAEKRKKAFQRARERLQADGVIALHADYCWIITEGP